MNAFDWRKSEAVGVEVSFDAVKMRKTTFTSASGIERPMRSFVDKQNFSIQLPEEQLPQDIKVPCKLIVRFQGRFANFVEVEK
jgi:hypothetical protein